MVQGSISPEVLRVSAAVWCKMMKGLYTPDVLVWFVLSRFVCCCFGGG